MLRTILMGMLAVAFTAGTAVADEASVRQKIQAKFPNFSIERVSKAPLGLYEVVLDGEIVYTDEKVDYFFGGAIYDIRTLPPRNITEARVNSLSAKALAGATASAIKRVKGNGKRTLYTFEDPNCGFCKKLYKELAKVTDVTQYVFLVPILSRDSVDKARAIWCAKDRGKAWDDLMQNAIVPDGAADCATPIEKNIALMRRFGIQGTPAVYLANGQQIGGYLPAEQIEQALQRVSGK